MAEKFRTSDFKKVVTEGRKPPNCDETLNIHINSASDGVAVSSWQIDERYLNGVGVVMGGFVSSAADITMAYALASLLEDNQTFASLNLHTTFHRPVFAGEALVTATVERMGNKIAYLVCDVKQNGKNAANIVSSVMILEA